MYDVRSKMRLHFICGLISFMAMERIIHKLILIIALLAEQNEPFAENYLWKVVLFDF